MAGRPWGRHVGGYANGEPLGVAFSWAPWARHVEGHADGEPLGVELTAVSRTAPAGGIRRGPVRRRVGTAVGFFVYADGQLGCPEAYLAQGAMPTVTLGLPYADGQGLLRPGLRAVGMLCDSCSGYYKSELAFS
jgi:hypothetical protein